MVMERYMNFRDTLTDEQRKTFRHCLYEATKYFNVPKGSVLHHKDITLKETNLERYIQWLPEDLVVMTKEEHIKLHHTGAKRSEETRKKMSEADKGKQKWLGKHHTEEAKQKISEAHKGKVLSEEHRKHLSEACMGRKHSEETIKKMCEAQKLAWAKRKAKEAIQCT